MKKIQSKKKINRRIFIKGAFVSALAASINPLKTFAATPLNQASNTKFKLHYAPHFGMFKHHAGDDPLDQLKFISEQGFMALEDNNMMSRPKAEQEKIASAMSKLGMKMGVFVAYAEFGKSTFVYNSTEIKEMLTKRMELTVETAKRVNAQWTTVVPGAYDTKLAWEYQTANVVENLKWCADICEKSGLIMVLEPLNAHTDHPGLFLSKIPQAFQICKAVDSPSCKILDDLYHQQITEGNLIPNIDMAWDEIAYFQMGDNPGRKEPGTGEINFKNIFKHIFNKGYKGLLGMEHGNSIAGKEGELKVIDAYRNADNF
jgi:hydroxypyruvate isomerase